MRLIELLNEKKTPIEAPYKNYTPVGNLFRLLLVVNAEHPIPANGPQNAVSLMLGDLDGKEVKKLQAAFNKINKINTLGNTPTIAIKKEYFSSLFKLLLPNIESNKFKDTVLINQFSSNSKDALVFQRKATVLLGKSLLNNKSLELNEKDRLLIKGVILGFEAKHGEEITDTSLSKKKTKVKVDTSDVVTDEVQPVNVVDKHLKDKSNEALDKLLDDASSMLENVHNLYKDKTPSLDELIKNNTSTDIFKVNLTKATPEINKIVNDKLVKVYNETTKTLGKENANFSTKFISDIFKNINSCFETFPEELKNQITCEVKKTSDGFNIVVGLGTMGVTDDEHIFYISRKFKVSGDKTIVYNDKLQIPERLQGTGINKKIFKDSLDLYKAKNVSKITLQANVDVGGYAWFRYGFVPQDTFQIGSIAQWIIDVAPVVVDALQYDAKTIADFITENTYDKTPGTQNLVNLISKGKNDTTSAIINKLFTKCSDEFQDTFDDKSKFKELGRNIANMNFKEYKIGNNVYSISYKALLSIQAVKDVDGFKAVPMNSYHGAIHLGWMGELDMEDLTHTYAYLNLTEKK